ncbi:6-carboxytetrahydropterin synthase QueD [Treponema parvum]|uniref:6-carboxy-5,6,7,8-tetrahydropterin synthase n=1 Tax=Treponema parvum TaxID=138851 RepID=A0A975F5K0_9SPIR|nr:6-carboxytetrahydropterin synthase QueD [Treponema parvum]QTQ14708.1 6-carboxytetrahydropterin synthase QueD [Treponema parvum]
MFEIRVETDFAAAHFLCDYHGKCENLHGHNYKVFSYVRGVELGQGGMLIDFSLLKKILKTVIDKLDHTNLNDMEIFCGNPSAERIAKFIFDSVLVEAKALGCDLDYFSGKKEPFLYAVDVFETDRNRARYCPDL